MLVFNIMKHSFLLVLGALAGGLLILMLPYAWIAASVVMLIKLAIDGLLSLAERNAGFGWRPLQSYLTGRKEKK